AKDAQEQARIAEENYKLARELSVSGVNLIFANEPEIAAYPDKHDARQQILKSAAKAFRGYLAEKPNDRDMRQRTSEVYRYAANVHRLANERKEAERLYKDSIEIAEGLTKQFSAEGSYSEHLSETLKDYSQLKAGMGRLDEADELLRRSVAMAEALRTSEPD